MLQPVELWLEGIQANLLQQLLPSDFGIATALLDITLLFWTLHVEAGSVQCLMHNAGFVFLYRTHCAGRMRRIADWANDPAERPAARVHAERVTGGFYYVLSFTLEACSDISVGPYTMYNVSKMQNPSCPSLGQHSMRHVSTRSL